MSGQTPRSLRPGPPVQPGDPGAPLTVAYYMPHNDGVESGILDAPGQTTGLGLVDLYEVDGEIRAFDNRQGAENWLQEKGVGPKPTASPKPPGAAGHQPGGPAAWSIDVGGRQHGPRQPPADPGAPLTVAYYMPHNEGVESGILDAPGQTTGLGLVDLYEVDGEIRAFDNRQDAEGWLQEKRPGRQPTASQTPPEARWTARTAFGGRRHGPRGPDPDPELEAGP